MGQYLEIAADRARGLNWTVVNMSDRPGVDSLDLTNLPTPYADNQFDGIYSEHFIEHMHKYQGINFLKEAKRILKPGGTIRTVWPPHEFVEKLVSDEALTADEDEFVHHYHQFYVVKHKFAPPGNEHRSKREQCALGLLHQHGEHLYVWGKDELMNTLKELGFKNVKECGYGESTVVDFNGIETPGKIRALHSAVVEAKVW
jgi:ubiquinone/menaquinone biosynthesis C-methylase UbiE